MSMPGDVVGVYSANEVKYLPKEKNRSNTHWIRVPLPAGCTWRQDKVEMSYRCPSRLLQGEVKVDG